MKPENTKTEDRKPKTDYVWIIFAALVVFVYFFGLTIPLLGPDEPRYAQVAREMYERGDWITPTLGGFAWFEKPALLYWLEIIAYKIFGVTEFAARFGSALFGLGTILCLWILGKQIQSSKSEVRSTAYRDSENSSFILHPSSFANRLALIAASSVGIIAFSRAASFDIILTFPITAGLVAFFIFDQNERKSGFVFYFPLVAFYFFIGVALLAKGLVGIVFPLAIVAFYYLLARRLPSRKFIFSLIWGTMLALAVAAVWYVPVYLANGWQFVDEFFIQHHFQRFTSNKYQHPQPFWFFFAVLPLMTLPWLPFFCAAIWNFLKVQSLKFKVLSSKFKVLSCDEISIFDSPLSTFAFAWLLVPLVFFSLSGSKLPGYILPALPAAFVLTAQFVTQFVGQNVRRERALQIAAAAVFVIVLVVLQFFVADYARGDTMKNLIETADANGYANAPILNLHTIEHNAEFYAAGRLARDDDGKLKRFYGAAEIVAEMRREKAEKVLVIVPLEYSNQLLETDLVRARILGDNGEAAIIAVESK